MFRKMKSFTLIIYIAILVTCCISQSFSQTNQVYNESWALLIGVNKYPHLPPNAQLQFAVADVMAVRQMLIENFGFREDHVVTLIDEQATKYTILDAMSQFTDSRKIDKNDRVLIHFSGHGQTVKSPSGSQMGFLITHDAEIDLNDTSNVSHYYRTCLGMDELSRLSGLIPAKHVLFLVDACYSGAAVRSGRSLIKPELPGYLEKVVTLPARQIVVAGNSGQEVFEENGHGVFTYKLLEALRYGTADLNNDKVTTVTELSAYLSTKVMEGSGGKQTPYFGRFLDADHEGEFVFQHPQAAQPELEDREPPEIEILPRGSRAFAVEADSIEKLIGIAKDNSGVRSVTANGKEVGLTKTDQGWRFEITIDQGEIEIKAIDAAGNSNVFHWRAEATNTQGQSINPLSRPVTTTTSVPTSPPQAPAVIDTEPPKIVILEPAEWQSTRSITLRPADFSGQINLVGIVSDNVRVTQLEINREKRIRKSVMEHGGQPALQFEHAIDPKETKEIEIYAADEAGNSEVVTLTINIDEPNTPPRQQFSPPAQTSVTIAPVKAEMALIPAGEFQMGAANGGSHEKPVHIVYVDAFYIDKYEVTNEQYARFIEATGHHPPAYWRDNTYNQPNLPVVGVSWDDAVAYANWAGKRLPTEAEWERAARGNLAGQEYPWGNNQPAPTLLNMSGNADGYYYVAPVGSYSPNGYGLYDMAGNVWEWVADTYDKSYYGRSPQKNPLNNQLGSYHVIRGGGWSITSHRSFRCANRDYNLTTERKAAIGFRCAKSAN